MRKILITTIFIFFVVLTMTAFASAEDVIVETPYVKIVINGKITSFNDVPLSINQRTMLPLREILVNLGVQNDDEHIVWNNQEKSVTIFKDSTKIYLKQGSKTAYVNDVPVTLEVAPISYEKNQRTYIPTKFVSQALGKKVVWDGSAKAVLIRDADEYDEIKQILDKNQEAMAGVKKCRAEMDINATIAQNNFSVDLGMSILAKVDREQKAMHLLMDINAIGMKIKHESYYKDGIVYSNNPMTRGWIKETVPEEEYNSMFDQSDSTSFINVTEPMCAGLVLTETDNEDELLLKGDVYLDELYNRAIQNTSRDQSVQQNNSKLDLTKFNVEIVIDKNTYRTKKIDMMMAGNSITPDEGGSMVMNISILYSGYDEDFMITVPQDVLDSADDYEAVKYSEI